MRDDSETNTTDTGDMRQDEARPPNQNDAPDASSEKKPLAKLLEESEAVRRALEEELAAERNILETFLENTPDSVYFKNLESRLVRVSAGLLEDFDLANQDDAVGKTDFEFFGPEHAGKSFADEQEIMRTGRALLSMEEREDRPDGSTTWASSSKMPLRDTHGNIIGTFGITRHTTQRKLTEFALEDHSLRLGRIMETQGELERGDKEMTRVAMLICQRSHELTTAEGAAILLRENEVYSCPAATGLLRDLSPKGLKKLERLAEDACLAGRSIVYDEATTASLGRDIQSTVVSPVRRGESATGAIVVVSDLPDTFGEEDTNNLQLLSVLLSSAVSHTAEVEAFKRFQAIYDGAAIGIALVNNQGKVFECNPALATILGRSSEELLDASLNDLAFGEDVDADAVQFNQLINGERDFYRMEKRYYAKNGDVVCGHLSVSLVRDADGNPQFAIEMIEDITARKHAEEELRRHAEMSEYQALHDALTDLPNRVLYCDRVEQALLNAEREGGRFAVMLLDLDRFKEINDTFGHAAGDVVLKEVSNRLHGCLRASDTIARLGGDEFGLLLLKQTDPSETISLLNKLSSAIKEPISIDGLPLMVEGSIGIAYHPDHGRTFEELMKRADAAMYKAKEANRAFEVYEQAGDYHDPLRVTLLEELRKAIDEHELVLYYQPKASLADGNVVSVEALVRWNHPERGLIPPDEFIPHALETGLMKPLTIYVLDEAMRQVKAWQEEGLELAVSVNLATRNVIDVGFPNDVAAVLEKWGVDASHLELEITESTMLEGPFRTKVVFDRLHAMGIKLSIDDFGTGQSSLAYLRQLPVDEIKIDRSFVLNMCESEDDAVIVRSTIGLGRDLGLHVIAEGVETEEAWQQLTDLGCEQAQGYFLSRPVPAEELRSWLEARGSQRSLSS